MPLNNPYSILKWFISCWYPFTPLSASVRLPQQQGVLCLWPWTIPSTGSHFHVVVSDICLSISNEGK